MKKANVLLLMCDQFRGDCLSIAHHPDVKTPYLDSLANYGVLFEQGEVKEHTGVSAMRIIFLGNMSIIWQKSLAMPAIKRNVSAKCMFIRRGYYVAFKD